MGLIAETFTIIWFTLGGIVLFPQYNISVQSLLIGSFVLYFVASIISRQIHKGE